MLTVFIYSDAFLSNTKLVLGNALTQALCEPPNFVSIYLMKYKSEARYGLTYFFMSGGSHSGWTFISWKRSGVDIRDKYGINF